MHEGYPEMGIAEFDKPREECGVFGVYGTGLPVTHMALRALKTLQHRGQEGAGIASSDGNTFDVYQDTGLVNDVFGPAGRYVAGQATEEYFIAAAHARWGTVRTPGLSNKEKEKVSRLSLQPMIFEPENDPGRKFTLSVNGHVEGLEDIAIEYGIDPHDEPSDTGMMRSIIGASFMRHERIEDALMETLPLFKGAFSLVVTTPTQLLAARDPHGTRPLNLGWVQEDTGSGWVIASERAALDVTNATFAREVEPGELISIYGENDIKSYRFVDEEVERAICAYEFIYFSRPDNVIEGEAVVDARESMGVLLAEGDDIEIDAVVGVPNSGIDAANGYAWKRGMPHRRWIVKNDYVSRSFILPTQGARRQTVRDKLNPVRDKIAGMRLAIVDDSIIRGTTQKELVAMLREAGAREIHLRITSPRYTNTCHSGMDTGDSRELIAAHLTDEEICRFLGADSIKFLTVDQLQRAVGKAAGKICVGCATGNYPSEITLPDPVLRHQSLAVV